MNPKLAVLAALVALLPLAAGAQGSYRCVGKDGKKYYGSTVPPACLGQPVEQMNSQGMVVKRFDAAASAAEREKKAAEDEERKKREVISKEEGRRNRALLATYTNEKDIDQARGRALKDNEIAVKDIETRIGALRKRQDDLKKELEFYQGKNKPPAKLDQDVKNTEFDVKTQQDLLAAKKKEVDLINARYDEDKKRYNELTKGGAQSSLALQLAAQDLVHLRRVGLALAALHHLPDQGIERLFLARAVVRHLLFVRGQHLVDDLLDRAASLICFRPFFSMMSSGEPSPVHIASKTSLAILPDSVPSATLASSFRNDSGETLLFEISKSSSFSRALSGPAIQFANPAKTVAPANVASGYSASSRLEVKTTCLIWRKSSLDVRSFASLQEVRHFGLDPLDLVLGNHQRQQVGIREIAVVLRVFLGAHGARLVLVGIVQARFLHDLAAVLEDVDLALRLELDGLLHEAERVEVLDLAARAELVVAGLAHRDVGVAAERALLHVAVADADPAHQRVHGACA